jgi:pimeloyl-ACP methyl ester carboxylesterase
MKIAGIEHWITGKSAHDRTPLRLYLWEKRIAGDPEAFSKSANVVLLVHGSRRSGRVAFDLPVATEPGEFTYSLMDALAGAGYDVFSLDAQCYGRSDHPPSGLAVRTEVVAADIAAAVEHIRALRGIEKILLVGWSWGATTAAIYTEMNPSVVRRLVLYGGRVTRLNVADGGPLAVSIEEDYCVNTREVSTLTLQPQLTEPKVLDAWLAEGERWDLRSPNGVAFDFQTRMPLASPGQLKLPVLVTYGAQDFQLRAFPAIAQHFAELGTDDRHFAVIPNAGHAAHLHHTRERFAKTLLGFFEN